MLLAAHGTRDPQGRATVAALAAAVADRVPGSDVVLGWLDHAEPTVAQLLAERSVERVVPLLLGDGYHVHHDLAELTAGAIEVLPGIGPGPELTTALADRLAEAGWVDGHPVLLAATGSALAGWRAAVQTSAELLGERLGVPVRPAFLSGAGESVADGLATLGRFSPREIAVSAYLLAPGHFHSLLRSQAPGVCAAPLGVHPALVELLAARCR
ncbi:sirohydrochlorin chelatase [Naumannella sp. ID2617S]|nr:sirohydrochlorin chelatase [Naumannella sp. ID2617S]